MREFEISAMLKRPKGLWAPWQPKVRIEPKEQLESKNPVIRDYTERDALENVEKCDEPLSNQGPAADLGEKPGGQV